MLSEFERIEAEFGMERGADLRKACRYLIRNQFAYSGDRGVATIYNTLSDGRFRRTIDDFFDCLGYRVIRDGEEQWVGIILDDDDASSVPKLKMDETVVVLVLAGHWQEEADRGNLQDRAVALTTLNILHERYRDMLPSPAKAAITPSRFSEILKELTLRNLIWIGELDREQQDKEVEIRPMIKLVSGDAPLRRIEDYIRSEEVSHARPDIMAELTVLDSGGNA